MRILLVGCGRMGSSLARSWIPIHDVFVQDPRGKKLAGAKQLNGLSDDRASAPDAIVVAVKPSVFPEIAPALRAFASESLVISIMAGVTLAELQGALARTVRIVRAMPNTPAAIGRGITAAIGAPGFSDADKEMSDALLGASGAVSWVAREADLDVATAVSGSGPAYFFRFVEALAQAGETAGIDRALAAKLARATFTGAAALAEASNRSIAELREDVTSPGGTTAAGLDVLSRNDSIDDLLLQVVEAAAARSRTLGQ